MSRINQSEKNRTSLMSFFDSMKLSDRAKMSTK